MFRSFKGTRPQVSEGVFIGAGAQIIGDVRLSQGVGIWYNCVLRGDNAPITVGEGSNVQDLTMIHTESGVPATIGKNVTIGHLCIIHGAIIGDNCLVGMGAVLMNNARIGDNSLVAAGSLVTEGKEFPPNSLIMGRPAKVVREVTESDRGIIQGSGEGYRRLAREHAAEAPVE